MARALIVGCGCRGVHLGRGLADDGWEVRGTSRSREGLRRITAAGIEGAAADPNRAGTVLELVADVAVVVWALGRAGGPEELLDAVNGPRLERVLEHLVDTPVRGFVYDASGPDRRRLDEGERIVREAPRRWRLPVEVVGEVEPEAWAAGALAAVSRVIG